MRVVIAGGGTGGHVFPGIAVAEEFRKRDHEAGIVFMGTARGLESSVVPREGYPLVTIEAEGVLGRSLRAKASSVFTLLKSSREARRYIKELAPEIVIGTGGYVSVPPVAAANTLGIPTLLLEQNFVAGYANQFLGRFARMVAITYHESAKNFADGKTRLTGNPIRQSILRGDRARALATFGLDPAKTTVFVLGGSAGAVKINGVVSMALNNLLDLRGTVQFLHQTGQRDIDNTRKMYRSTGFDAHVTPFIEDMGDAYAVADVMVSRAGATTLSEITAVGMASILIPYPHAAGHQDLNARALERVGGCVIIEEKSLSAADLAVAMRRLAATPEEREMMKIKSRALGRPDAAARVVDLAIALMREGRRV